MAREAGTIPAQMNSNPVLARCGWVAGILWFQGRSECDVYGRLPGDPEVLAYEVMRTWVGEGQCTVEDVRKARDAMVSAHLWHLYRDPVTGRLYVEYENYDADQAPSWLTKRAARSTYPDPPDRPELAAAKRPHYVNPKKEGKAPAAPAEPPSRGSADLPAETPPPVPSGAGAQAATPAGKVEEKAEVTLYPDGFNELRSCHEQHSARFASIDDRKDLLQIMQEAERAGVEWQTLLTVMRDVQARFKEKNPGQVIKFMGYYCKAWREHIAEAAQERRTRVPESPPPEEQDEEPPNTWALRAKQQTEALLRGDAHAATATAT